MRYSASDFEPRNSDAAARHASRDAVIAAISCAFDGVSLGGGISLHQARALDNWEPEAEAAALRDKDREVHWSELTDEKMRYFSDVFPFLDQQGWAFYIPAYVTWSLRHEDDTHGDHRDLAWSAIYSITNRDIGRDVLTAVQRAAIVDFLVHLAEFRGGWHREAQAALDTLWIGE